MYLFFYAIFNAYFIMDVGDVILLFTDTLNISFNLLTLKNSLPGNFLIGKGNNL